MSQRDRILEIQHSRGFCLEVVIRRRPGSAIPKKYITDRNGMALSARRPMIINRSSVLSRSFPRLGILPNYIRGPYVRDRTALPQLHIIWVRDAGRNEKEKDRWRAMTVVLLSQQL